MPTYRYEPRQTGTGCDCCRIGFERVQRIAEPALAKCPECGIAIRRVFFPPQIANGGRLDERARSAGFHKLKRVSKGEYEKEY